MTRADGRADDELRPVTITRNWLDHAAGSVLVEFGRTRVLCAASATEGVPRWRKGSGLGWVTAEYAMLPASTNTRSDRESVKGRIGGRTHEISRLIGRSLRAVIDYEALGENTIQLDCDVLQADGGTRTAAITGAYVALADAVAHLRSTGALVGEPLTGSVAAVSVGIIDGAPRLDLPYEEDVRAETDMNIVMTGGGRVRRGAGHRRGRGVLPRRARRAARTGREGLCRPDPAAAGGARLVSRVFLASRNAKKLAEMERILRRAHRPAVEVLGLDDVAAYDEPVEDQPTFEGNALLKARAGLAVHRAAVYRRRLRALRRRAQRHARRALRPLVRAPQVDDRNNQLLLAQLADVPDERRGAHFICAVAFCAPVGAGEEVVDGGCDGRIIREARGDRRLRLRRGVRGRRPSRRDDGRAPDRGQGRDQPPRQGAQGAGTARRAEVGSRRLIRRPTAPRTRT